MDTDNSESDHESGDQERSDAGKEDHKHAEADQAPEGLRIAKRTAKDDKWLIRRTEQVQKEPCREETKEDQQRKRVGEEGNGEDNGDDGEVVDSEIGVILADTKRGLREGLGLGKSGAINKLGPRTTLGKAMAE